MYNFYQSRLWKNINKDVYRKPTCEVHFFGNTYQGIIREKKYFGRSFRWIQILGVEGLTNSQKISLKKILDKACKKYHPFCIQIGFTDIFANVSSHDADNGVIIDNLQDKRTALRREMHTLGYKKSFKENLPPSTILINLTENLEKLWGRLGVQHKAKIKKAVNNDITCNIAVDTDIKEFYGILKETSMAKGFSIVSDEKFESLIKWCLNQNNGNLYVAKKAGKIVAGSLYLIDNDAQTGIYLYGATDKRVGNIGAGQALHRFVFCDLQEKGIQTVDLLGGGPIGDYHHPLSALSKFKEGFGGEKIEYIGSYDLVYNILLYKIRSMKH